MFISGLILNANFTSHAFAWTDQEDIWYFNGWPARCCEWFYNKKEDHVYTSWNSLSLIINATTAIVILILSGILSELLIKRFTASPTPQSVTFKTPSELGASKLNSEDLGERNEPQKNDPSR